MARFAAFVLIVFVCIFAVFKAASAQTTEITRRAELGPPGADGKIQDKIGIKRFQNDTLLQSASLPNIARSFAATLEPEPYFYVTWTATANGKSDISPSPGYRITKDRHIVMAGNSLVRIYPDGEQDNFPLDFTATDDYDRVTTGTEIQVQCPQGGTYTNRQNWFITDPGRFSPDTGTEFMGNIRIDPVQRPNGNWYISDPFPFFYVNRYFHYEWIEDRTDCGGTRSVVSDLSADYNFFGSVYYPAFPEAIEGNGNLFTTNKRFSYVTEGLEMTVDWTFVARRLLGRDLTVDRLEVTQGLQDRANSIPLVQGRRTVVRAYIALGREQTPVDNVTARLRVFSGGTALGTVNPFNPGGRITARPSPNWLEINHTLNFEVPLPWTEMPSLRFEVEVNPDATILETDSANNKLSASLDTKDCDDGISIGYVPIHFTPPEGNFGWPEDPDPRIAVAHEFMRKIYPIPESGLKYSLLPGANWRVSLSYSVAGDLLLAALESRRLHSSPRSGHIFGWLPRGGYTFALGFSTLPGTGAAAWGQDRDDFWRLTLAHEIAHNKGLNHAEEKTGGSHWFDVYERKIKPPYENQQLFGMMKPSVDYTGSEATGFWISPTQYRLLINKMCRGGSQIPQESPQSPTVNDNLIVTGTVSNLATPAGTLGPLYRTATASAAIPEAGTSYCVNLRDAAGIMLSQYCFSISFEGEGGTPATAAPFGMAVPYPAGLNRVELAKGSTVLSTRLASANPPSVTLTFPNASGLTLSGMQNVTWNGNDPDGGTLTYSLLHSRDNGATWIGIGSGITGNSDTVDFSLLPGGTSGRIKVMVSDGFRSAEDVTDNPFSVANKPPIAAIVSPPMGTSFPSNTRVTLQATGSDLEDGSLGDAAFTWSSDRDGALSSGQVLETSLSVGTHTITMTARDSGGLTTTATITCSAASITSIPSPTPTPYVTLISGRVTTPSALGLRNAVVTLTDPAGVQRIATTSSFGVYTFGNVPTGQTYLISISSKRYRFAARSLLINEELTNVDFVGLE